MQFDVALGARLEEWQAKRDLLARGFSEFLTQRFRHLFGRELPDDVAGSLSIRQRVKLSLRGEGYESSGSSMPARAWGMMQRELAKTAEYFCYPVPAAARLQDGGTESESALLHFVASFGSKNPGEDLRAALELDPDFKEARYHLAKDMVAHGRVEEAAALMRDVLFLDDERNRDFAGELWRRGHPWEAREVLREACDREPDSAANCRMLASVSLSLGSREEARSLAARAVALDPGDYRHWRLLGDVQRAVGETEKAIRYLRLGLAIKQDDQALLESLAACLLEEGRIDESIEQLEKAIALEPRPELLGTLAFSRAQKSDWEGAMEAVTQAIEKDGGNPRFHILAGDILIRRGDALRARTFFEMASTLAPGARIQFEGGNLV